MTTKYYLYAYEQAFEHGSHIAYLPEEKKVIVYSEARSTPDVTGPFNHEKVGQGDAVELAYYNQNGVLQSLPFESVLQDIKQEDRQDFVKALEAAEMLSGEGVQRKIVLPSNNPRIAHHQSDIARKRQIACIIDKPLVFSPPLNPDRSFVSRRPLKALENNSLI